MSVYSGQLKQLSAEQLQAFSSRDKEATLLWIECGSCNGESMAILGAEGPGKTGDNLSDFLTGEQVRLLWHPSLSETTPKEAAEIIDRILDGCLSKPWFSRANLMSHCIAAKKKYKLRHPIVRKSVPSTF